MYMMFINFIVFILLLKGTFICNCYLHLKSVESTKSFEDWELFQSSVVPFVVVYSHVNTVTSHAVPPQR